MEIYNNVTVRLSNDCETCINTKLNRAKRIFKRKLWMVAYKTSRRNYGKS